MIRSLKLFILLTVFAILFSCSSEEIAIKDCDKYAAHPFDPNKKDEGVYELDVKTIKKTIKSCKKAVKKHPNDLTYQFQLARLYLGNLYADEAYEKSKSGTKAQKMFEVLYEKKYFIAGYYLYLIHGSGHNGVTINEDKSEDILLDLIEKKYTHAYLGLAELAESKEFFETAETYLEEGIAFQILKFCENKKNIDKCKENALYNLDFYEYDPLNINFIYEQGGLSTNQYGKDFNEKPLLTLLTYFENNKEKRIYQIDIYVVQNLLAVIYDEQKNNLSEAVYYYKKTINNLEEEVKKIKVISNEKDAAWVLQLVQTHTNLAMVYGWETKSQDSALKHLKIAQKIIEKFLTEEKISEFYKLGYFLDSAIEDPIFKLDLVFSDYYSNNLEYEKSIEFLEKFKKNYDEYFDYIPEYYYDEKALNQLKNQNYQESIKNFTKYKKEITKKYGYESGQVANTFWFVAYNYIKLGLFNKAKDEIVKIENNLKKRGINFSISKIGSNEIKSLEVADYRALLGLFYAYKKEWDVAYNQFYISNQIIIKKIKADHLLEWHPRIKNIGMLEIEPKDISVHYLDFIFNENNKDTRLHFNNLNYKDKETVFTLLQLNRRGLTDEILTLKIALDRYGDKDFVNFYNEIFEIVFKLSEKKNERIKLLRENKKLNNLKIAKLEQEIKQINEKLNRFEEDNLKVEKLKKIEDFMKFYLIDERPTIKDFQNYLKENEAMFAFFDLPVWHKNEEIVLFIIKKNEVFAKSLPSSLNDYKKKIKDYRLSIECDSNCKKNRDLNLFDTNLSYSFYEEIFKDFESNLKDVKNLIIIPNHTFYKLPFNTLITTKAKNNNRVTINISLKFIKL